jgi:hypothetical protein
MSIGSERCQMGISSGSAFYVGTPQTRGAISLSRFRSHSEGEWLAPNSFWIENEAQEAERGVVGRGGGKLR